MKANWMSSASRYRRRFRIDIVETLEARRSAEFAGSSPGIDKIVAIIYSRAKGKEGFMWVIIILVVVGLAMVFMYNRLVALKNRVRNAWHQIDVQLKRRYDLIPNLVETVKGYARHEKEVFERVTEARTKAMGASSVKEASEANNMLSSTLKSLFAVAEAYPELKANQNFLRLQEELTSTENKIAFARQFYNDVTMQFNISIQKVPLNLIAMLFNFKIAEYWEVPEGEKGPVEVKF